MILNNFLLPFRPAALKCCHRHLNFPPPSPKVHPEWTLMSSLCSVIFSINVMICLQVSSKPNNLVSEVLLYLVNIQQSVKRNQRICSVLWHFYKTVINIWHQKPLKVLWLKTIQVDFGGRGGKTTKGGLNSTFVLFWWILWHQLSKNLKVLGLG